MTQHENRSYHVRNVNSFTETNQETTFFQQCTSDECNTHFCAVKLSVHFAIHFIVQIFLFTIQFALKRIGYAKIKVIFNMLSLCE